MKFTRNQILIGIAGAVAIVSLSLCCLGVGYGLYEHMGKQSRVANKAEAKKTNEVLEKTKTTDDLKSPPKNIEPKKANIDDAAVAAAKKEYDFSLELLKKVEVMVKEANALPPGNERGAMVNQAMRNHFVVKQKIRQTKDTLDMANGLPKRNYVTRDNYNRIRINNSLDEVADILGDGVETSSSGNIVSMEWRGTTGQRIFITFRSFDEGAHNLMVQSKSMTD